MATDRYKGMLSKRRRTWFIKFTCFSGLDHLYKSTVSSVSTVDYSPPILRSFLKTVKRHFGAKVKLAKIYSLKHHINTWKSNQLINVVLYYWETTISWVFRIFPHFTWEIIHPVEVYLNHCPPSTNNLNHPTSIQLKSKYTRIYYGNLVNF